jgi:curved DNA-binding protein CbpA
MDQATPADAVPIVRHYLDDIDDDSPSTSTGSALGSSTAAAATSNLTAPTSAQPARSGVDDIDDDTPAAGPASSPTAGDAKNESPPAAVSPAEAEVRRIQAALARDQELASSLVVAPPANGVVTATPSLSQPDYFSILGLPQPTLSITGEAVWPVEDETLKEAFKRLVLLVHPDKCHVDGAKGAFEAVKAANTVLAADSSRFDYLKSYIAFRRALALRSEDYLPPSTTAASLDETLAAGRQMAEAKKKQANSLAARLLAQSEARRQAVLHGQEARRKEEERRRSEELKRKVMGGDSEKSSGSDSDEEMSVAEKIRRAKQTKKKIRLL